MTDKIYRKILIKSIVHNLLWSEHGTTHLLKSTTSIMAALSNLECSAFWKQQQEKHYISSSLTVNSKKWTALYMWLSITSTRGKVVQILSYHEGTSRNGGIDPRILNLGTRWRSKPQSVYFQGKNPNTCWNGDWVEPTVSLDTFENRKISCPCWPSNL